MGSSLIQELRVGNTLVVQMLLNSIVRRDDINSIGGRLLSKIIELYNVRSGTHFLFNCALGEK